LAAVLEYMGGVHTVLTGWSMGIDTLYDAGEGTIIVEMHGAGTVVATGKPYKQDYIAVLKVANEKVDLWREYSNPLPVFEAFGNSETVSA
jgi:ketosteroid isomerase-like protein